MAVWIPGPEQYCWPANQRKKKEVVEDKKKKTTTKPRPKSY